MDCSPIIESTHIRTFAFFVQLTASNAEDVEPFKFVRNYVGLHEDQINAIRNGKAVAKIVESRTPDEVFVFGSVYVRSTPQEYLKLASDIAELCKLPNYLALRKFSDPPQLSDLEGFTLEPEEILGYFPDEVRFDGKSDIATRDHFLYFTFRL